MAGSGREIPKGKLSLIVTAHHPVKETNPTTFLDFHLTFSEALNQNFNARKVKKRKFALGIEKRALLPVKLETFSIKYEDLPPVPQEPTTFLNKEDIKRLNDWRNEFGRGVRQQSVRNSFTKDKAGTLPFYMYMSEEPYKNAEEQALTSMQGLFEAVSSAKEADNQRILQGIAVAATKSP